MYLEQCVLQTDFNIKVNSLHFHRELDLNSPRGMANDELGLFSMIHPSSPDSSTDTSKNVCNVCGKT